MSAYITVGFTPRDEASLQAYGAKAASTIAAFEGEFLAKSPAQALNGVTTYQYQAIIAFPSKAQAENWYNSPQYQALIQLRDEGMDASFQLVG